MGDSNINFHIWLILTTTELKAPQRWVRFLTLSPLPLYYQSYFIPSISINLRLYHRVGWGDRRQSPGRGDGEGVETWRVCPHMAHYHTRGSGPHSTHTFSHSGPHKHTRISDLSWWIGHCNVWKSFDCFQIVCRLMNLSRLGLRTRIAYLLGFIRPNWVMGYEPV